MLVELKLSEIAAIVEGRLIGSDCYVKGVSTDSREDLSSKLFLALVGERFNGNEFASKALEIGAAAVLVSEPIPSEPRIEVTDTAAAYRAIARHVRRHFSRPVIAITGSNGKTSVKDWLAHTLSLCADTLKTQSNLNNQIGVPKTLLGLAVQHQYAVIEAGTSFPGEIEILGNTIEADVVVLTNASGSHLLGFGSIEGIAVEKGKLIETARPNATIILNADDPSYEYWKGLLDGRSMLNFSFTDASATLFAKKLEETVAGSTTTLTYQGRDIQLILDRPGKHHVANAMAVALAMLALGFEIDRIINSLKHPEQVSGRMELLTAKSEAAIINDCYNASPKSVEAAIDVLSLYKEQSTWLALGALGELGDEEVTIHQSLGNYAAKAGIDHLITIGPVAQHAADGFSLNKTSKQVVYSCQTKDEALNILSTLDSRHVILVKGSRSAKMEDIVNALKI